MPTITIDLPDTFTFESRGEDYTVDLTRITTDSANLAVWLHGLKQKLADKCNAKADPEGVEKAYDAIVTGAWRIATGGSKKAGLSALDKAIWAELRAKVQKRYMEKANIDKVKQLTEDAKARIDDLTDEAFDKPVNRENPEIVRAAETKLAAIALRKATVDTLDLGL